MKRIAKSITAAVFGIVLGGVSMAAPASALSTVYTAPPSIATAKYCNSAVKWQTTTKVNLRSGPTLNSKIKGSVPTGACLSGTDQAWDSRGVMWIYTSYNGKSGWISTRNLY